MLKKILTAITALAVVASLLAGTAGTAAAATGYNSAYFGESAFLTMAPGASGQFAVGFNNTGSTGWLVGSATQVDLTVCLADKLTCNVTSPNAAFANGWLSSTAYATTSTTFVGPGQTGFFVYNVTAPSAAAAGTYRFQGDLALHGTASMIHQQGYYQDADVAVVAVGPPAVLISLDPETGSTAGGDSVTITGTGIKCTPTNPTVKFGTSTATITSCGSTQIVVDSPAHAAGDVDVTVTNQGAPASNALTFTYADTTAPTYTSLAVSGSTATLTFSEPVCVAGGSLNVEVRINGSLQEGNTATFADCDADETDSTATVDESLSVTPGDTVSVTISASNAPDVQDADANSMEHGQTRSATAAEDVTAPTIDSVEATADDEITVTLSEQTGACGADDNEFVYNPDATGDPSVASDSYECNGDTILIFFPSGTFTSDGVAGDLEANLESGDIEDEAGNSLADFDEPISPIAGPTIDDATVTDIGVGNRASIGDSIVLTFSENMNATTTGDQLLVRDSDVGLDTIATIECAAAAVADNNVLEATCAVSGDTVTVTLLEDSTDTNELEQAGATTPAGLQWPAEITDTSGYISAATGTETDLANSADTTID